MLVRLRTFAERFRTSLFFLPALYVLAAMAIAAFTISYDRSYQQSLDALHCSPPRWSRRVRS